MTCIFDSIYPYSVSRLCVHSKLLISEVVNSDENHYIVL